MASLALIDRRFVLAAWCCGLSALQNPTTALFIGPVLLAQLLEDRAGENASTARRIQAWLLALAAGLIVLIPYAWNYIHFGRLASMETVGDIRFLDPARISVLRTLLFVLDLNEGLIVGMPFLLWLVPLALIHRAIDARREGHAWLRREDLLLLGFLLMLLPTLAQTNWSASFPPSSCRSECGTTWAESP